LAAAQQAVLAFQQLPPSAPKTFIYTGNILNTITMAPLLSIGVGKAATAHIIQSAAAAYQDLGFRYVFLTDGEECGKLTGCRFIMPMRGKWMDRLRILILMGRRMGAFMCSLLRVESRESGCRRLSRVWDIRNSSLFLKFGTIIGISRTADYLTREQVHLD
jgi:hypothetical protein